MEAPTPSAHRLRHGLPGYLILFATHAFAPQRQLLPRDLPSPSVFLLISAHFTATPGIPVSPTALKSARIACTPGVKPRNFTTTRQTTYELFTPSNSGQRSHPTYYRGCWHVVSRCFLYRYRHLRFVPVERSLQPEGLHPHAASLHQASAHCAIFPTAASRRSLGRISVPMWPYTLSGRLPVDALVGHYPTNKLIGRELILHRKTFHN